jgi:hypothetical protein
VRSPGANSIQWIRADGDGEAQLLLESKSPLYPHSVSPEGQRRAFTQSAMDSGLDLWTLPLDVSDPEHSKPGKPELFLVGNGDSTWSYHGGEIAIRRIVAQCF